VFALDADTAGQQQWRQLARQAALRGKQVAVLEPAAYGGHKDVSAAWAAGVLAVGAMGLETAGAGSPGMQVPTAIRELWEERVAIIAADSHMPKPVMNSFTYMRNELDCVW